MKACFSTVFEREQQMISEKV
jgi:hypothetical protein